MSLDDENDYNDMFDDYGDEGSSDAFEASDAEDFSDDDFDMDEKPAEVEAKARAPKLSETLNKVEQVPLNISVELTRFKMTCEKLMQIKPGNLLELNVPLEKPVDLVANGKAIGQGELIRVGEVLGVRILNIG